MGDAQAYEASFNPQLDWVIGDGYGESEIRTWRTGCPQHLGSIAFAPAVSFNPSDIKEDRHVGR